MILIIILDCQAWWLYEDDGDDGDDDDDDDDDDDNNNNNNNRLTRTESNTDKTAKSVHVLNFFYEKPLDSLPHSLALELLSIYKINSNYQNIFRNYFAELAN